MNKSYKYVTIFSIVAILLISLGTLLLLLPKNSAKQSNILNSNINTNTYFCGDSNISKPLFENITQEDGRFGNGYTTIASYTNYNLDLMFPEIKELVANNPGLSINVLTYIRTGNLVLNVPIFINQDTNSNPDSILKFYNGYLKAVWTSYSQSSEKSGNQSNSNTGQIAADSESINKYLERKTFQANLDLDIIRKLGDNPITNINQIPITKLIILNNNRNAKLDTWLKSKADIVPINSQTNSYINDTGYSGQFQLIAGNDIKIAKLNKPLDVCNLKASKRIGGIIGTPINYLKENIDNIVTITTSKINTGDILYNSMNVIKDPSETGTPKLISINQSVNIRNISSDNARVSALNSKINAERSAAVEHDKWMSAHYVASISPPPGYSKQPIITSDPRYYSNDVQQ